MNLKKNPSACHLSRIIIADNLKRPTPRHGRATRKMPVYLVFQPADAHF